MFQLHKDVFSLTSTHNITMADNWQEDIGDLEQNGFVLGNLLYKF